MKKLNLNWIVLPVVLVFAHFAKAEPLCVGNFASFPLTWTLDTADKADIEMYQAREQRPEQQWECANVPAGRNYEIEISRADRKYSEKSCILSVKAGDYVQIADLADANAPFNCVHIAADGKKNTPQFKIAGADEGWTLYGSVILTAPVKAGHITIYDTNGKVVLRQSNAVNSLGAFAIKMKTPQVAGFRVEVSGVPSPDGGFLDGSMATILDENFDIQEDMTYVNVVTTLVASLYSGPNSDYHKDLLASSDRVRDFLGLSGSVNLNTMVTNPYYSGFSTQVFLNFFKPKSFRAVIGSLRQTMIEDNNAEMTFRQPKLLKNALAWSIAKPLLVGAGEKLGGHVFQKFLTGIGMGGVEAQVLDMFNRISAQLQVISDQIEAMHIDLKDTKYEMRVNPIDTHFGRIRTVVERLEAIDKFQKSNPLKLSSEELKKQVAQRAADAAKIVKDEAEKVVMDIHTAFVPTTTSMKPFQLEFAEGALMKQKKLIRPEYFQLLNDQVDEFKSMQALSAVLLADLKKAEGNEGGANELIEQVLSWVDAEKRMLPSTFPLNKPAVVKKIESNEGVYQYTGKRLWLFSMKTFNSIGEFQTYRENGSGRIISADNLTTLYPYTASQGDVISLIDDSGNRGADFREVLQSVGWSKAQAEALKMIAWTNGVSRNVSGGNFIDWSGNDGQGPFRVYHDPHAQFWKVASDKGLKGLVPVMTYQPLQ